MAVKPLRQFFLQESQFNSLGAEVSIDGMPVGVVGQTAESMVDVLINQAESFGEGVHTLKVKKEGFEDLTARLKLVKTGDFFGIPAFDIYLQPEMSAKGRKPLMVAGGMLALGIIGYVMG